MTQALPLIDHPEGLTRLAEELDRHRVIGVDTESNSFFAYRDRVSLLQFSAGQEDYLVDPLAVDDFSALDRVMTDPSLIKIFHDGEQDLQLLRRDLNLKVKGLFDTKVVVSAFAGRPQGLASLVGECFDIHLDKGCQRSNWSQRPLSDEQLKYAKLDTRYLARLRDRLAADLAAADPTLAGLVELEHARIEASEPLVRELGPEFFHKVKGARRLTPEGLRLLAELYRGRDEWARHKDMPPGKAVPDATLTALAKARPAPGDDFEYKAGLPRRSLRRHRPWIQEALTRAAQQGPLAWREIPGVGDQPPPDDKALDAQEQLRTWRRATAEALGCEPALVLHRSTLAHIADRRPTELEALAAVEGVNTWWVERFGTGLLTALRESKAARKKPWRRR